MRVTNADKAQIFNEYLGARFKTFEIASPDSAPISFVATDHDDKQYFVYVEIPKEEYVSQRENTGIAIENAHFYQLYAMMSQGQNVFWYVAFSDGYMLFYLNDSLTPEQLNVLPEQTLIGAASALHIQKDQIKHDTGDGKSYVINKSKPEPTIIQGSLPLGRVPKTRVSKRKK
jgi:hypothetical protein